MYNEAHKFTPVPSGKEDKLMFDMILIITSVIWFCNTEYFDSWSRVKIGGSQVSVTVSAFIIIIYLVAFVYVATRWYYSKNMRV